MTRQINAAGLDIIKRDEGLRLVAYRDIVGVTTIGYGHTPASLGQQITQAQADALLAADVGWAESTVDGATHAVATTDNQFSAMVSLTFNIGPKAFLRSSVLRDHLGARRLVEKRDFEMWDMAGGREVNALLRRRDEEAALYLSDEPATNPNPGLL